MKRFFVFLLVTIALSCDDGHIDIPGFDFSNVDIKDCGDLVLYKINGNETLVIELSPSATDENFFLTDWDEKEFPLGTDAVTYRTFDDTPTSNYFCQNIPPTTPSIINEWIGTGELIVNTIVTKDDEDGVSAINESGGNDPIGDEDGDNILNYLDTTDDGNDGDGSITDYSDVNENDIPDVYETDKDMDGFPDYIDWDDDNDGVLTKNENPDPNNDGDLSDAQDTDTDGIPDYLDEDDDEVGVDTILELTSDSDGDGDVDYLDADTATPLTDPRTRDLNQYQEIYKSSFVINLLKLTNSTGNTIQYDTYIYGSITDSKTNTEEIP